VRRAGAGGVGLRVVGVASVDGGNDNQQGRSSVDYLWMGGLGGWDKGSWGVGRPAGGMGTS
jgi:hypothetical protein